MHFNAIIRLTSTAAVVALSAACQTVAPVPEQTRLSLLQENQVDYSRFPERRTEDTQEGRGLMGDSLALTEKVGDSNLLPDVKLTDDLKRRLDDLLPSDYTYKVGENVLSEYPLDTRMYIYDLKRFDAHALETGDILFTNTLLMKVYDQDTIDWIIAHEAGHQLHDHHKSRENRETRNQVISILGSVAMIAAGDSRAGNLAFGATAGALLLNNAGIDQFELKEEIQADQLAMDLLLDKETPRNPNAGIDQLKVYVKNQEAAISKVESEVENTVTEYVNYCGEAGLFAQLQTQSPHAQTRTCQQWYVVGQGGVESYYGLPDAQKTLEKLEQRVDAAEQYHTLFIAARPVALPPIVDFEGKPVPQGQQPGERLSYAQTISKNGRTVRSFMIRRVDELLEEGRCQEAVKTARDSLLGPQDADTQMRFANYRAEKRCPSEAKAYKKNKTKALCKPAAGHFGAYEHLCFSRDSNTANGEMLALLQQEFEDRSFFNDAYEVFVARREKSGRFNIWLPEEIELLRKAGRDEEVDAQYETCMELEDFNKDFKDRCERAAYPERFQPPAALQDDAAVATPSDNSVAAAAPPPLNLIGYDPSTTYDVFEEALVRTELNDLVRGDGEFTVYMPSDGALRRHLGGEDPKVLLEPHNRTRLRNIISAHIVRRDASGEKHLNSPHLKAGFDASDEIEGVLQQAGGVIHGSATYGAYTLKPVDTVIETEMRSAK